MINGLSSGAAQQIPASNTFQPGGGPSSTQQQAEQLQERQETDRSQETQESQAAPSETQENPTEARNAEQADFSADELSAQNFNEDSPRGSVVDVTV